MKVFQTNCDRKFAAINIEIPTLMPMTSGLVHVLFGLKASTRPYRFQQRFSYCRRMWWSTARHPPGRKGNDPPAAAGTTVPSIGPIAGGPPQTTYPWAESDAVIPHSCSLYFGNVPERSRQNLICARVALTE